VPSIFYFVSQPACLVLKPSVALNSKPIVITETVQLFQPTFLSLPSCETFCEPVSSSLTKQPLNNTVSLSPYSGNFIEKGVLSAGCV
jgi:hypothetical protein